MDIGNYLYKDCVKSLAKQQELSDAIKTKCKKEIENLTAMNVDNIEIVAKGIQLPEEQ